MCHLSDIDTFVRKKGLMDAISTNFNADYFNEYDAVCQDASKHLIMMYNSSSKGNARSIKMKETQKQ